MSDTYDPSEHTVDEVKEYVNENPDQADEVLAAEQAGKNRSTLTEWLENEVATAGASDGESPAEEYERQVAEAQEAVESVEPTVEPLWESGLPPALADAGLVGMRALVAGVYTTPAGTTFALSPGIGYAVSAEDAQALAAMGVVVTEQTA